MKLQERLAQKQMSMYRLSKLSGVPKTTVIDICAGRSSIESCTAKTVWQLAKALDCTMEELMEPELPKAQDYLELGLPAYLQESIAWMQRTWETLDRGEQDLHWDAAWCNLNADLNSAEVEQEISSEQAWYLRRKYLRMEKESI